MIVRTANILKAVGEPTRLKIVKMLSIRELCICELAAVLDMSQPRISQHVKVLKRAGVLKERRVRQNCYLSLNQDIFKGAIIEPLVAFMETDPGETAEMEEEYRRYLVLDINEDVIACKKHTPARSKVTQIVK